MEIIKRFNFNNNELSVYGTPVKPWFKAKDVVMMLGYSHTKDAIKTNVDLEDVNTYSELRGRLTDPLVEMHPDTKFINESGLYALIFGSKKAEAKKFKHWVTSEVLPSIRKTGKYAIPADHTYDMCKLLLDVGNNNTRDKLLIADVMRNKLSNSKSSNENDEWSVSRRLNEHFHITDKFRMNKVCEVGKILKEKYMKKYKAEPPKREQYVGGTVRQVYHYTLKDFVDFGDNVIEKYYRLGEKSISSYY